MTTLTQPSLQTRLLAHLETGGKAVGYAGTPFPTEIAEALDLMPVSLLDWGALRDPQIEAEWIDDKEDPVVRSIFVGALRGDFAKLAGLVSTRVVEHSYYYLREVTRLGAWNDPVPLHMFDLMPLSGTGFARYNRAGIDRLVGFLERIAKRTLDFAALETAVARANSRRAELREAARARAAAAKGKRLLLVASAPVNDARLNELAEQAGWSVVGIEDGSARFNPRDDLRLDNDPLDAIARYYAAQPTAISHPRSARSAFIDATLAETGVDGVLFWMHRGDQRLGWDFPPLRDGIEAQGVAVGMVRADIDDAGGREAVAEAARQLYERVK